MDELMVIPYVWAKDHWTLPHTVVSDIWKKMLDEGISRTLFCSGSITKEEQFHLFMRSPFNCVMTQWLGEEIVFLGWLNNFMSNSAYAHFTCFKKIWGTRTVEAMKNAFKYWFDFKNNDGSQILDTIIGIIADDNQLALNLVKKCGVRVLGTIPNYSKNSYANKKVGGNVCYIEKDEVKKWGVI